MHAGWDLKDCGCRPLQHAPFRLSSRSRGEDPMKGIGRCADIYIGYTYRSEQTRARVSTGRWRSGTSCVRTEINFERSEERRVGKGGRAPGWGEHVKKQTER